MANTNPRLIVTDLDFDSIKENFKTFLKSQDKFKDYNFEGSGMNILLDILSYGIHYHAYYTNMASNESFADTAILRDSVISKAKELDYLPKSKAGAIAYVNLTVIPPDTDTSTTQTLPKYTKFLSSPIEGTNFIFCTISDAVAKRANTSVAYVYSNLQLTQGRPFTFTFPAVDKSANPTLRFEIPDTGIDISTLQVSIQQSTSNTITQIYSRADDITEIDETSLIYFLEPSSGSKYTIQFGDGVTGATLSDGNIVSISYLSVDGDIPNGANSFSYFEGSTLPSGTTYVVSTATSASGGAQEADIETIRFNSLKGYGSQNRAVTPTDYEILMRKDYPYFDAISVWGGEDNDPPIYGSVFVSLKPKSGFTISAVEKDRIVREILSKRNVVTVTPRIVDPEYTYIRCEPVIRYDPRKTTFTEEKLKEIARNVILDFTSNQLNNFSSSFRLSQFLTTIVNADPSFLGCDMKVVLEKRAIIVPQIQRSYTINFSTELRRGSSTNRIYMNPSFSTFDGFGILRQAFIEETPGSSSGIDAITIDSPGENYSNPTIEIIGDAPEETKAIASATVVNGRLQSINLDQRGEGYTAASIVISDPTGFGANASAILSSQVGTLRSYYFASGQKIILNQNAGTIYYPNGSIILENFFPQELEGDIGTNEIRFIAQTEDETVAPLRNNIITIDENDSTSIVINMIRDQ